MASGCLAGWSGPGARLELRAHNWPSPTGHTVALAEHQLLLFTPPVSFTGRARFPDIGMRDFVEVGTTMYYPADCRVEYEGSGGATVALRCNLGVERIAVHGTTPELSPSALQRAVNLDRFAVREILSRIARELQAPSFASDVYIDSLITLAVVELFRCLGETIAPDAIRGVLDPRKFAMIRERVEARDIPLPSVRELAALSGLSERHLTRLFRQTTGQTVNAFIQEAQLRYARDMLGSTDLPLKEIAYRLGFETHSAFSNAFRRLSGEAPSAYRRRVALRSTFAPAVPGRLH